MMIVIPFCLRASGETKFGLSFGSGKQTSLNRGMFVYAEYPETPATKNDRQWTGI